MEHHREGILRDVLEIDECSIDCLLAERLIRRTQGHSDITGSRKAQASMLPIDQDYTLGVAHKRREWEGWYNDRKDIPRNSPHHQLDRDQPCELESWYRQRG